MIHIKGVIISNGIPTQFSIALNDRKTPNPKLQILNGLAISLSGGISLSNEESGTHLNFKNQKVEVMSLFYGFSEFNIVLLISLFPYFLIALSILFSGSLSLFKEESGTQSFYFLRLYCSRVGYRYLM